MRASLQYRCKLRGHQFSGKNEFASTWTQTRVVRLPVWCSTTELQSETSFHRLCCAFIVSVSLKHVYLCIQQCNFCSLLIENTFTDRTKNIWFMKCIFCEPIKQTFFSITYTSCKYSHTSEEYILIDT